MTHLKEINTILPLEILYRIFGYLDLTDLVELSKINSFYMQIAKISYIEKVIKSKLIMEINLGTEQPINIRYECAKYNRKTEQTIWKPTAIIGTQNKRSVNTKEKVILRKIYFEKESEYYNLVHEIRGEMDIKDAGIECIKGEESLIELSKKYRKNKKDKKLTSKKHKNGNNKSNKSILNDTFEDQKNEMINTELSSDNSIKSRNSICSENSIVTEKDEDLMVNNDCLFFFENDALIKNTIKWSFEYKVESIIKPSGDSWQKLQPSRLKLPVILFFQNKTEEPIIKKRNYTKYKSLVKKNLLNFLERFSNSFVGVV